MSVYVPPGVVVFVCHDCLATFPVSVKTLTVKTLTVYVVTMSTTHFVGAHLSA